MIVFVDNDNQIKDVGNTNDVNLNKVFLDEKDACYPFKGWNVAKICCYKVVADENGVVLSFSPYVHSKLIGAIDALGNENTKLRNNLTGATSTLESILIDTIPQLLEAITKLEKENKK